MHALLGIAVLACLHGGCGHDDDEIPPLIDRGLLESDELVEVLGCRHSHEHALRHVRIFTLEETAFSYTRCVIDAVGCTDPFPAGTMFVKFEYEYEGCAPEDLVGYTVSQRLEAGSYPEGLDWHWQELDPRLRVTADGAPPACIACHVDHCSPPYGHDLRCTPD